MDTKRHARFLRPGHAVTGDRTRNSKGAGFEFVHTIVDDCSRLAYAEVADDERAATVSAFTERALDWFLCRGIVCERLLTDNAWSYTKNKGLAELLDRRAIAHRRTKTYSPKTNGKVERLHRTMDREWARGLSYRSSEARRRALPHWLRHYNGARRHSALGNRPPLARVRDVLGARQLERGNRPENPRRRRARTPQPRGWRGRRISGKGHSRTCGLAAARHGLFRAAGRLYEGQQREFAEQVLAELHGISAEMRAGFNRIRRRWPAAVPVQIAAKDVRERDSRLLT